MIDTFSQHKGTIFLNIFSLKKRHPQCWLVPSLIHLLYLIVIQDQLHVLLRYIPTPEIVEKERVYVIFLVYHSNTRTTFVR
jgi:hypothetical protein